MKANEISSELIEPHLKKFLCIQIESVALGMTTPNDARRDLQAVDYFVSISSGIHARYAVSNEYSRFTTLSDEDMIRICKKSIENYIPND